MATPAAHPDASPSRWRVYLPLWVALGTGLVLLACLIPPGTLPFPPGSRFSDSTLAHWPAAWYLHDAVWTHHSWPLWNPDRMLGQPFSANPLNKVYYPPQWLALCFPPTVHLNLMIALHAAVGIWGGWLLGRQRGYSSAVSAAFGLAWMLLPKTLAHLGAGHLDIFYALAWLPWLGLAWLTLSRQPTLQTAAHAGLASGMLALADLRIAFYALPFTVGWALIAQMGEPEQAQKLPKTLALGALATLVCGLLLVVYLAPLAVIGPYLTRSLITVAEAGQNALSPANLAGLLIPDLRGSHETFIYLPGLLILLAILGLGRWREAPAERLYFALVALIAGLWAFGPSGPIFTPIASALPLATWFRGPARAWFFVSWAMLLLAADGLHSLSTKPLRPSASLAVMGAALLGLLGLGLVLIVPPDLRLAAGGSFGALMPGALGLWMIGQRGLSHSTRAAAWSLAAVSTFSVLAVVGAGRIDGKTIEETESVDRALIAAIDGCGMVYSPSFDLVGAEAARARMRTLHGVNPLQIRAAYALIGQAAGYPNVGYSVVVPAFPADAPEGSAVETALVGITPDAEALADLGVQWISSAFLVANAGEEAINTVPERYIYQFATPLVLPPCAGAPNRLAVALASSRDVVAAYVPGWMIRANGQWIPASASEQGLIRLPRSLSAGELVYRPAAEFIGIGVSGVTLIAAVLVASIKPRKAS